MNAACAAYLDTILPCGCEDFAGVELQRSHSVVVLESFRYPASSHVPYLKEDMRHVSNTKAVSILTRIDLSKLPLTIWISSNCRLVIGPVCPSRVRWAWPVRTKNRQPFDETTVEQGTNYPTF